jgi:hypothetical protein
MHHLTTIENLSNEACSLFFDSDVPCVVMEAHGYATSQQFRDITENMLFLLKEKRVSKMLVDTTHLQIIGAEDQKWLNEDWLPRAIAAGYRACAMIKSKYFFNRVAVDNVVNQIDQSQLTVQYFDDRELARTWLKNF